MSDAGDDTSRAERIAAARAALAQRYADDPQGVARFNAKMARLSAARKRERERFETRVLGNAPEPAPLPPRPKGMSKAEWKVEKVRLREEALAAQSLAVKWRGKAGTPETLENFEKHHTGALAQLHANGVIDDDQLAWAQQIASVAEVIQSDVTVRTQDLEWRVDPGRHHHDLVGESISRVRAEMAYTRWRDRLPAPKGLVLDMLIGFAVGYTVAARRHHVHARKAKRELIAAIDRWPDCVEWASRAVSAEDVTAAYERLA